MTVCVSISYILALDDMDRTIRRRQIQQRPARAQPLLERLVLVAVVILRGIAGFRAKFRADLRVRRMRSYVGVRLRWQVNGDRRVRRRGSGFMRLVVGEIDLAVAGAGPERWLTVQRQYAQLDIAIRSLSINCAA